MKIKFHKPLNSFKYLVMFDLASKITGVCLWDIEKHQPCETSILHVKGEEDSPVYELYQRLDSFFNNLYQRGIKKEEILVSQEAMPTQVHGGSSTVQTFLALARSHAVLDLYMEQNKIAIYDFIGVYPITTHAYFKHLMGWNNTQKVTKDCIRNFVREKYNLSMITLDESDAVFLAQTLVDKKWNSDLQEEIKNIKKHKKTLKSNHAIQQCDTQIDALSKLKIV